MGDFVFFFLLISIFWGIYMEELGRQCRMDLEAELNWNSVIYSLWNLRQVIEPLQA